MALFTYKDSSYAQTAQRELGVFAPSPENEIDLVQTQEEQMPIEQVGIGSTEPVTSVHVPREMLFEQDTGWYGAVNKVLYVNDSQMEQTNATFKFSVCFLEAKQCVAHSQGYRDEMRKLTYFMAPSNHTILKNHVALYLYLKDEQAPRLVMRFCYAGRDWLYLQSGAILVDGNVVFEQLIPSDQIKRESLAGSIKYEIGDVWVTEKIDVLEQIANAKQLAVRLTGRAGDTYVEVHELTSLKRQAAEVLYMDTLLRNTIKNASR